MYLNQREGWIEVITGPMFAGKTEELIRRVKRLEYAKQNILVFKPQIDSRYASNEVVSHNNTRTKSINIAKAKQIMDYVDEDTDVVAIDEIQFMDEDVVEICEYLADHGIRVIVSGLDRNFRGETFSLCQNSLLWRSMLQNSPRSASSATPPLPGLRESSMASRLLMTIPSS